MATITGFTAERMLAIEQNAIVSGAVVGDNLILTKQSGATVDAGHVRGDPGPADLADWANLVDPPGTPKPNFLAAIPTGHGACDAQTEYDGTLYPLLAAGFGTGAACVNGSCADGFFRLPDLRGRTIFGLQPGVSLFDTLLEAGGSRDAAVIQHIHPADQAPHGHTADQAPHGHTADQAPHTHGVDGGDTGNRIAFTFSGSTHATVTVGGGDATAQAVSYTGLETADPAISVSTEDPGISVSTEDPAITISNPAGSVPGTDQNVPPYRVANWIMRLV